MNQYQKLRAACGIGTIQGYQLGLSNSSPDDERIRVRVQKGGVREGGLAKFWCGSAVELDRCYFGFEGGELDNIRELLAAHISDIRKVWEGFAREARIAQAKWLPKLLGPPLV